MLIDKDFLTWLLIGWQLCQYHLNPFELIAMCLFQIMALATNVSWDIPIWAKGGEHVTKKFIVIL